MGQKNRQNRSRLVNLRHFREIGLEGKVGDADVKGGSLKFAQSQTEISEKIKSQAEKLAEEGKTPLMFLKNGILAGMIAVADVIREDSPQAVKELQNMGIEVVMLTGDNERTARAIGAQAGVDDVIAGVLPDGKESVIRSLREQGKVAMVGDGINDAPALTRADIGIAIGAGTDIAIDAADVVLMKSRLSDVPAAVRLSRATLKNIPRKSFLGIFLQCDRHSTGCRCMDPDFRMDIESDVRCRRNESFQLLRCHQCPSSEPV